MNEVYIPPVNNNSVLEPESDEEYSKRIRDNSYTYSFISIIIGILFIVVVGTIYPPIMDGWLWIIPIGIFMVLRWLLAPYFVMSITGNKRG